MWDLLSRSWIIGRNGLGDWEEMEGKEAAVKPGLVAVHMPLVNLWKSRN
jgi:hypothetical protein